MACPDTGSPTNSVSSPPLETHLRGRVPLGRNRNVPASKKCPPQGRKISYGRRCAAPHSQGGRRYSAPRIFNTYNKLQGSHTRQSAQHVYNMFTRRRCCSATRSPKATKPRCRPGRYSSPTRPETAKLLCPALSQGPKQVCPGQKSVPRNTISRRTCIALSPGRARISELCLPSRHASRSPWPAARPMQKR